MFLRTPKCPMELEGKQCLSSEVAGAYPPSPVNLPTAHEISPAPGGSSAPWFFGLESITYSLLACPAPLGIRTSTELSLSHLFSAGSLGTLNRSEPPLAPRSCLANSQYSVSAVGREQGFPVPVRPLETSLYWALHGRPHPPPQKRQNSHLPKMSASLFCPIFVFISKTSPAFFFL